MADYETLALEVEKLSLPEVAQFVKFLEERWGVTAAAPMMMGAMPMMGGGAGGAAEAVAEQTEFDVVIEDVGAQKIKVIKALREVNPELGLKEAKDLAESDKPLVAGGVNKERAAEIKAKLEDAGAKVGIR